MQEKNKMKSNTAEDNSKITQSKSTKKSTKSRTKSAKSDNSTTISGARIVTGNSSSSTGSNNNNAIGNTISIGSVNPTSTINSTSNALESVLTVSGGSGGTGSNNLDNSNNARNHAKSYAGLEPRSIKIIWEQHDQSDVELSAEVCAHLAEDASYKLWELINNVKTYARHSGNGVLTYDLVNEVLRDSDVPPTLGAMDSDWDRIDYDGSYFFYSDKILELRDEYQKDVTITMPNGADYMNSWPVESKNMELLKKYIPNLIYVALYGDVNSMETVLTEASSSHLIGSGYRVILAKLIQILAFKQHITISERCWQLLRACSRNSSIRASHCRLEYFHLSEILICQLLGPYENIKAHHIKNESRSVPDTDQHSMQSQNIKMEIDEIKLEEQEMEMKNEYIEQQQHQSETFPTPTSTINVEEKIYKLHTDDDDYDDVCNENAGDEDAVQQPKIAQLSPYFSSPVDWSYIDELCTTIGHLAVISGYFQSECLFHITRRLQRFFSCRHVKSEKEFNFISRAVRGLISLGEYAFREFIPFIYKFKIEEMPEVLWHHFAVGAVFLNGADDIFLYEWLSHLCGADKLQPFMVYYAQYHDKLLTMRFLRRKVATFKIKSKVSVRRLEWNTLAAAMCHGDDPNKELKPRPMINEVFPELIVPYLKVNRAGTIRFKFAGCRPVILKPKEGTTATTVSAAQRKSKKEPTTLSTSASGSSATNGQLDILIARRKLYKPLTNERRIVPLSSYYHLRI